MDRRSNVAQLETVAHGNGYFGDGFSRPFSNGGCPEDGAVVAHDDLDQPEPVVFVHGAVVAIAARKLSSTRYFLSRADTLPVRTAARFWLLRNQTALTTAQYAAAGHSR